MATLIFARFEELFLIRYQLTCFIVIFRFYGESVSCKGQNCQVLTTQVPQLPIVSSSGADGLPFFYYYFS